jgi:hypothetical protein
MSFREGFGSVFDRFGRGFGGSLGFNRGFDGCEWAKSHERPDRVFVILQRASYPTVCRVVLSQAKAEKWVEAQEEEEQHTYEISEWEPK